MRKLFQATGYYGVFDAEFIECEGRKLLIDVNPRFYNHMAFEIDRGLPLAWLAYLAAIGDRENLKSEIKKVAATPVQPRAYVHRLPTALLLLAQRLGRGMSREEQIRWRRWISKQGRCVTDPARAAGDPVRHSPRSCCRLFPSFNTRDRICAVYGNYPNGLTQRGQRIGPTSFRFSKITSLLGTSHAHEGIAHCFATK